MLLPMSQPMPEPQSSTLQTPSKPPLSPRELDVARLVALGHNNLAIATELGVAVQTVKNHLSIIYSKLSINSRIQLALWMIKERL